MTAEAGAAAGVAEAGAPERGVVLADRPTAAAVQLKALVDSAQKNFLTAAVCCAPAYRNGATSRITAHLVGADLSRIATVVFGRRWLIISLRDFCHKTIASCKKPA